MATVDVDQLPGFIVVASEEERCEPVGCSRLVEQPVDRHEEARPDPRLPWRTVRVDWPAGSPSARRPRSLYLRCRRARTQRGRARDRESRSNPRRRPAPEGTRRRSPACEGPAAVVGRAAAGPRGRFRSLVARRRSASRRSAIRSPRQMLSAASPACAATVPSRRRSSWEYGSSERRGPTRAVPCAPSARATGPGHRDRNRECFGQARGSEMGLQGEGRVGGQPMTRATDDRPAGRRVGVE